MFITRLGSLTVLVLISTSTSVSFSGSGMLIRLAFHLLRVATEAVFLFELNKVLGALLTGGSRAVPSASAKAEAEILAQARVATRHVRVRLPDGVVMHTLVAGRPGGNPVVLLHGHSMCGALFFAQLRALVDAGARVYAPDLPGWGRSSRPRFPNRGDAVGYYVSRVLAWLDALSLGSFALVGHSLGGYLAHEVALARPLSVRSLVLVAPAAATRFVDYAAAMWFCFTPQRFISQGGLLASVLFALRYPRNPAYARPGVRQIIRVAFSLGAGAGDAAAAALLALNHGARTAQCTKPIVERVTRLECPVTLVAGEYDVLVPMSALLQVESALRAAGNEIALVCLPADHSPHLSTPELFTDVLKNAVIDKSVFAASTSVSMSTQIGASAY